MKKFFVIIALCISTTLVCSFPKCPLNPPIHSACPPPPCASGDMIQTPLTTCTIEGNYQEVKRLLEEGANPNEYNKNYVGVNAYALLFACMNGNLPIVKLLIAAGVDVNSEFIFGFGDHISRPIHYAKTPEIIQALHDAGADIHVPLIPIMPIETLIENNNIELAKKVLTIKAKHRLGRKSLPEIAAYAIEHRHPEVAEFINELMRKDDTHSAN